MNKQMIQLLTSFVCLWIVSFTIRWYYLPTNLFFGFEQGRDAIVIDDIRHGKDFVLVGPKTDIGGVFHGAWYYYLMTVPYAIGRGNPLVAAAFLIALTSLVPLLLAGLIGSMTGQRWWGVVAGGLVAGGYELIQYSRWLSNVTPAIPVITAAMACVWLYRQTKQERWWILAVGLAALAAQFQIILSLWFAWVLLVLLVTRWMKIPQWRSWLWASILAAVLFAPMVLFNVRNDWISLKSMQAYVQGGPEHEAVKISLVTSVRDYGHQLWRLWRVSLYAPNDIWAGLVAGLVGIGLIIGWTKRHLRPAISLLSCWATMTWLVIFFPKSLSLPQLYISGGVALLGLTALSLSVWWSTKMGKVVIALVAGLCLVGLVKTEYKLRTNQDVFFRTIQDDLNYRDEQAVLQYIHDDAQGQTYAWKAFSIPYFQEEGWQYLYLYLYPNDQVNRQTGSPFYLIIEKPVDAYWVKKWTDELGPTQLIDQKQFGLIRVEKRLRVTN